MSNTLLVDALAEPLNGAKTANVDIDTGLGNLTIDRLSGNGGALATGTLQYFERQGPPMRSVHADHGAAVLSLKGKRAGRPCLQLPWVACTGGTDWRIHLNPSVRSDISARTGGGNVHLNLAGMVVCDVVADSGGGNIDIVLPDEAADLSVAARTGGGNVNVEVGERIAGASRITANTGAGNVTVHVQSNVAARVHARTGFGKVTVVAPFERVDSDTYESPGYDDAVDRVEVRLSSGAGNVSVIRNEM